MKILYVSTLTSSRLINNFFATSGKNPGFSIQKFHRMLAKGFVKNIDRNLIYSFIYRIENI